jgi:pSer/pThr/pTyr-binding forkhead associated (FHA) protein
VVDSFPLGLQIFIKDVKSSNGTFVNGERLSVEGVESDPWELKSDDRVVCSSFDSEKFSIGLIL